MTLDDSIQGFRLRVLREAQRSGNVSAPCRRDDVSRTVFYRWRARLEQYGPDGVHPTRRTTRPGRAPALGVADERRVIAEALAWPTRGPQWVSDRLALQGLIVAPVTVWRVLRRVGLNHRRARLAVLEDQSATTGLLTERTVRRHRARHVEARQPGDLCSLDSFLHRQVEGGRQDLAADGLRLRLVVWLGADRAGRGHRGADGGLSDPGRPPWLSERRLAPDARADRQRQGVQGPVRHHLCRPPGAPHADEAAACVDQRIRGALAGHDSA